MRGSFKLDGSIEEDKCSSYPCVTESIECEQSKDKQGYKQAQGVTLSSDETVLYVLLNGPKPIGVYEINDADKKLKFVKEIDL